MPRTTESIESRILSHFRTAPLAEAQLLFGLVQGEMRQRTPKAAPRAPRATTSRAPKPKAPTLGTPTSADSIGE